MKDASFETVLKRLIEGIGVKNASSLGPALGISSQAISDAKKRGSIPTKWIFIASTKYGLKPEELLAPENESIPVASGDDIQRVTRQENFQDSSSLLELREHLRSLREALEAEQKERREISMENRQLHKENAELLREIGDLRAQVARLEERKNRLAIVSEQPVANSGVA